MWIPSIAGRCRRVPPRDHDPWSPVTPSFVPTPRRTARSGNSEPWSSWVVRHWSWSGVRGPSHFLSDLGVRREFTISDGAGCSEGRAGIRGTVREVFRAEFPGPPLLTAGTGLRCSLERPHAPRRISRPISPSVEAGRSPDDPLLRIPRPFPASGPGRSGRDRGAGWPAPGGESSVDCVGSCPHSMRFPGRLGYESALPRCPRTPRQGAPRAPGLRRRLVPRSWPAPWCRRPGTLGPCGVEASHRDRVGWNFGGILVGGTSEALDHSSDE